MVESASITYAAGKPLRLLVIDDDHSACGLIGRFAEKAGFIPDCAGSLEDAKKALSARRYDCITLDLGIGKSSGVEIFRAVAVLSRRCPIIVISGADRSVIDLAVAVGKMNELELLEPISKPIDFAKLKCALSGIQAGATATETEPDRRQVSRFRDHKAGTISFNGGGVMSCIVRNVSASGACLEVASPTNIPEDFVLLIECDQIRRHCRIAWRKERRIGVAFR
jgi:ActR/RegA family two-component response regulator